MTKINAIFAVGKNGEMGNPDGSLPWRATNANGKQIIRDDLPQKVIEEIKTDMENFKRLTKGNIVIMGYNTFKTFTAPLPNRANIVIDRTCDTSGIPPLHNTIPPHENISSSLNNTATTSDITSQSNNWLFAKTLEDAITLAEKIAAESKQQNDNAPQKEIFIIGGAKILHEALEKNLISGKVYKTVINADFPEATVRFKS